MDSRFAKFTLRQELDLRRQIFQIRAYETKLITVTNLVDYIEDVLISKAGMKYQVHRGGTTKVFPSKYKTYITHDFSRYRAVSEIIGELLGPEYASELKYNNIIRVGSRYGLYWIDTKMPRLIGYYDTVTEANDEYKAWQAGTQRKYRWILMPEPVELAVS